MMRSLTVVLAVIPLVAFSSADQQRFPAIADAGGCRLERITNAGPGESHFQFEGSSPDGRQLFVAWSKGEAASSYLLDLANGERRELAALNNAGVFSRDGERILVANSLPDKTTDIVEYDLASGLMKTIGSHPKHEFLATWSPDERLVLFNSYRSGASDIYVMRRDGAAPERLTDFEGYEAHAVFTPDMKAVLFHREVSKGDYDIYRIDFATRVVEPFVSGPGEQAYPSWSPDGRRVAFASDGGSGTGKTDIYVADDSGRTLARITREPGYNTYPSWSKDGRYLYFNSERKGAFNVYRVTIDGSGNCGPVSDAT
jgi:TolB protein